MAKPRIDVQGLNRFLRTLAKLDDGANAFLKDTHDKIAQPVAQKAKGKARRKSGKMAGTIKSKPTTRMARIQAGPLIYAPVQHFGWNRHGITPNRFMYEALAESEQSIVRDYESRLNAYVEAQPWP